MTQEDIVTVPGSWALSLAYTLLLATGHHSTWIQLQSLLGNLLASLSSTGFSGKPSVAFCFECCFLFTRGQHCKFLFFPIACSVGLHH